MTRAHFPEMPVLTPAENLSAAALETLLQNLRNTAQPTLIVGADLGEEMIYLFLLHQAPYAAARWNGERMAPLTLHEWFGTVSSRTTEATVYNPDPLFFKVLMALAQHAPLPVRMRAEAALEMMRQHQEALLVVRAARGLELYYFHQGQAKAAYGPSSVSLPQPLEPLILDVLQNKAEAVGVITDLQVGPAPDALPAERSPTRPVTYYSRPLPRLKIEGPNAPPSLILDRPRLAIGRSQSNGLCLDDPAVSREHTVIRSEGEAFLIEDLKSRNGTLVNGKAIKGVQRLQTRDEIQIGPYRLQFLDHVGVGARPGPEPAEETVVNLDLGSAETGELGLEVLEGERKGEVIRLARRALLIGRVDADLSLKDPQVSRRHGMIEWLGNGYRYLDLQSTNGTLVNGRKVPSHPLSPGDEIRIGGTLLRVVEPKASDGVEPKASDGMVP